MCVWTDVDGRTDFRRIVRVVVEVVCVCVCEKERVLQKIHRGVWDWRVGYGRAGIVVGGVVGSGGAVVCNFVLRR